MLTFLGGGRGCAGALTRPSTRHLLPKNFEKTALRKKGGHIYGKNEGWAYLRKLLYSVRLIDVTLVDEERVIDAVADITGVKRWP